MAKRKSGFTIRPIPNATDLREMRNTAPVIQTSTSTSPSTVQHNISSTYQPSSGLLPYGCPRYEDRRELVAKELGGAVIRSTDVSKNQISLLEAFFPNSESNSHILQKFKSEGKYGTVFRSSAKKSSGHRPKDPITQGWVDWPNPPSKGGNETAEKDIAEVFIPILNDIIQQLGLEESRVAIDRQTHCIPTRDGTGLKPDVFLCGGGSSAFPSVSGTSPISQIQKGKNKSLVDALPSDDWRRCVIPIELKTEKNRKGTANRESLHQLGTYVREILAAQTHRRFVPSLVLTECTVEFLLWDRAGVVVSERLDYHTHADRFCHILATILRWSDIQLGFDDTLSFDGDELRMETKEPAGYVIESTLFRSYTLRGRGSTCWLARRCDGGTDRYIIQDSWIEGGMAAEYTVLRRIEELRAQGQITGVLPFVHMEEVGTTHPSPHSDTIRSIRREAHFMGDIDLVHTRTISRCHSLDCKPLTSFSSPEEIIIGLQDATNGLRKLYEKANLVHRDIVPWNILLQPEGPEGSRGVLIDFSCATFIASEVPRPDPGPTPGSHLFRCRNSLRHRTSIHHLDDVESCYYILCFVIAGHAGPDMAKSRLKFDGYLRLWETEDEAGAARTKNGHFHDDFELPVQEWFGEPARRLAKNMHWFFRLQLRGNEGVKAPADDLRNVTEYFAQAARDIEPPPEVLILADGLDIDVEKILSSYRVENSAACELPDTRPIKRVCIRNEGSERRDQVSIEIIDYLVKDDASKCMVGTSVMLLK